jgi:hypothetical protein
MQHTLFQALADATDSSRYVTTGLRHSHSAQTPYAGFLTGAVSAEVAAGSA